MKQIKKAYLDDWQRKMKESMTPKPPDTWTRGQKIFFNRAVKKILFTPTQSGGLAVDYSALSTNEAFVIGLTGTKEWPIGIPVSVREKMQVIRPVRVLGVFPSDVDATQRLIELERRTISGGFNEAEEREHAVSISTHYRSSEGARTKKERAQIRADKVVQAALALRRDSPLISRRAAALKLSESIGLSAGQIQRIFKDSLSEKDWPLAR